MDISGIVLAGGLSSRMGPDKTLMKYNNETLIERTVREMSKAVNEIIIASNNTAKYCIPGTIEVVDIYTGMGPLGGIHAGLLAAQNPRALVVAADMPRFNANVAYFLIKQNAEYDVLAPEINGHLEPLCGIYSKSCIKLIEACLRRNVRQVTTFCSQVKLVKISEKELAKAGIVDSLFYNVNTPDDYQSLIERYKKDKPNHK